MNKLLGSSNTTGLPVCEDQCMLVDEFNNFFVTKVENIRKEFSDLDKCIDIVFTNENKLSTFESVSNNQVMHSVMNAKAKSCILDPIATVILKKCVNAPSLLGYITSIINMSLSNGLCCSAIAEKEQC